MKIKYLAVFLICAVMSTESLAKVKYGYFRNTSIGGGNMGVLEKVLAPGTELITNKVNIQALDYGFQGYLGGYNIVSQRAF